MARRGKPEPVEYDGYYFLYGRYSNDQKKHKVRIGKDGKKHTRERENLDSQFSRMHAECDRRGVPRDKRIEFADNDISASSFSSKERPGYDRLLQFIRRSRNCAVMAVEQSRLVRREYEGYILKDLIIDHGDRLALLTGDMDLSSESGDLLWTIGLFRDRSESRAISRRSCEKEATDRQDHGIHRLSRPPFGYTDKEMTTKHVEEAKALHDMRKHIVQAKFSGNQLRTGTIGECARMLEQRGFTSPVTGKPYSRQSVRGMLSNPAYAGWVMHKGQRVRKSTHIKPIFTDAQFDALQAQLAAISAEAIRVRGGSVSNARKHLLSGFLRCGYPGCGARMEIAGSPNSAKSPLRWRCTNKERVHTKRRYATVAEAVDIWVRGRLADDRVTAVQEASDSPRAAELDAQIGRFEASMAALTDRWLDPTDPVDDDRYFSVSARIADALAVARAERAGMERQAVEALPTDALDIWMNDHPSNFDARRALLATLAEHIVILPVAPGGGPKPAPLESVQVYPRRRTAPAVQVESTDTAQQQAS